MESTPQAALKKRVFLFCFRFHGIDLPGQIREIQGSHDLGGVSVVDLEKQRESQRHEVGSKPEPIKSWVPLQSPHFYHVLSTSI